MSSGGQGNSTTSTQSIPAWLQNAGQGYLQNAQSVSQQPYTAYQGQRIADLSPVQRQSIQGLGDLAGGTRSFNAADDMLSRTLQGGYSNPGQQRVSAGANPYMGDNPYFQSSLSTGLHDITDAYQRGTAADTTRMFNLAGAFGGSAHQDAMANNEQQLGRSLGNYENQMRQGQFDRSGQLAESGLNRDMGAQQFNATQGTQSYENERNRQMQAATGAAGLMGAQGTALTNALNAGDVERRSNQSLLDSQYGDFTDWRNYPEHQLGVYGNALGSLLGGRVGGTTTTQGPGSDPVAQGLGAWQLGSAMNGKGGGGYGGMVGGG